MRSACCIPLALLALAAGCGDDDEPGGDAATGPASTTESRAAAEPSRIVEVVAHPRETLAWTRKTYRTTPGNTEFRLRNPANGPTAPHNVAIEKSPKCCEQPGHKWIGTSPTVAPGERTKLAVDLRPGRYWLYCSIGGHWQGGMIARLVVG